MAKITVTEDLGAYTELWSRYDPASTYLPEVKQTAKSATYIDENGGEDIVLRGSGLTYDEGLLSGGTITKIVFRNSDDAPMVTIEDLDISAKRIGALIENHSDLQPLMKKILAGDDEFTGSALADYLGAGAGNDRISGGSGSDWIYGGIGNDRLHGGAGNDYFEFHKGEGKDVVVDFDAVGGGEFQDYLAMERSDVEHIIKSGADVILDLGDGDTVTLLNVHRADITNADFASLM